jgi:hypothetical protein
LAKAVDKTRVCPLLFGLEATDIKGPLVHLQGAQFSETEMKRVIKMMNTELGDQGLETATLDTVFDMWWPKLKEHVDKILQQPAKAKTQQPRDQSDILKEILALARFSADGMREMAERGFADRVPRIGKSQYAAVMDLVISFDRLVQRVISTKSFELIDDVIGFYGPLDYLSNSAEFEDDKRLDVRRLDVAHREIRSALTRLREIGKLERSKEQH